MPRGLLKWVHWLSFGLILYFFIVEPEDVEKLGAAALATHAGMGTILAVLSAVWFGFYLRRGLAGRPGPKLPAWAKRMHGLTHRTLTWGLPAMVLTGALAGFAAPFAIKAFGVLPLFPGIGSRRLHNIFEEVHEIAFNALLALLIMHVAFHLWRHVWLRDNALRIMVPKPLHRYL